MKELIKNFKEFENWTFKENRKREDSFNKTLKEMKEMKERGIESIGGGAILVSSDSLKDFMEWYKESK